ncbi:pectinesterase/pectinesterase inhibitor U1, partial [Tanacetum coccineum]
VVGDGFLARDITFENTAGAENHQAFYINCLVAGTVDFIFGNAAVVFQDCDIHARRPGRPWKQYARTVFMQSTISNVIHQAGWHEWDGNFALDTLYYGEYQNTGAGAETSNRVKWKGFKVITSSTEAQGFTPDPFIGGGITGGTPDRLKKIIGGMSRESRQLISCHETTLESTSIAMEQRSRRADKTSISIGGKCAKMRIPVANAARANEAMAVMIKKAGGGGTGSGRSMG